MGSYARGEQRARSPGREWIRATRQRLQVLEALEGEPNDATAQEILKTLRSSGVSIGLATVYRALGLLSSRGVVDAPVHRPGGGVTASAATSITTT